LPKTNVVTVAELLAGFGSKFDELTIAVFVIDAGTESDDHTRSYRVAVSIRRFHSSTQRKYFF